MNWELDGRRGTADTSGERTRRIHIRWSHTELDDAYLVFLAKQRALQTNSDAKRTWRSEDYFLGRKLDHDANNKSLIKSWLDTCFASHHGHCRTAPRKEFLDMIKMPFFGVIDVFNLCLTRLPTEEDSRDIVSSEEKLEFKGFPYQEHGASHAPYAALSYVWGPDDQIHKTTTSSILHLRGQGSLETVLRHYPKTIKDAIDLTRRMGIRYLWVDSCCIVQDSERVWKRNAQHMDLIYGNAAVTICAADGRDANEGLRALDVHKRHREQHIRTVAPGVQLMVSRLAETSIKGSTWNTRAWTFQERLLSKRCLVFAEGRVFFQCYSATMLEDVIAEPKGLGWSLNLVNVPSQLMRDIRSRPFYVYAQCIGLYSARLLTKQTDILEAFAGVENMLSRYLNGPLAFGLPTSHFDLSLLWEPLGRPKRRWIAENPDHHQNRKRSEFPSWSWCGWSGTKMVYKTELMQDVEGDVHSWLTNHTWIRWYIRDGNGYLRPLWKAADIEATEEHLETDARWVGYTQCRVVQPDYRRMSPESSPHRRSPPPRRRRKSSLDSSPDREIYYTRSRRRSPERGPVVIKRERPEPPEEPTGRKTNYYHRDDYGHNYYHTVGDVHRHAAGLYPPNPPEPPRPVPRDYAYLRPRYKERDYHTRTRDRGDIIEVVEELDEPLFSRTPPGMAWFDDYGRPDRDSTYGKPTDEFWITIPESPYTVKTAPYRCKPDKEFPDYPILQFWTWSAHLRIAKAQSPLEDDTTGCNEGLERYDIHDEAGDWCGSILLDPDWISQWEKSNDEDIEGSKHEFLALSDAKRFTQEECETWTYYIPKEREQSEWDLFYVLLVSRNRLFWHRVALGKVFKAGFENGEPAKNWKEIVLA